VVTAGRFACTVHHLEPKTGGTYRASFRNFTTGDSAALGGEYIELVPNERLRFTDEYKFEDPQMTGDIQVTVTLRPVSVGTELTIVQEGLPDVIPSEVCYLGWQQSLHNLARLVEPLAGCRLRVLVGRSRRIAIQFAAPSPKTSAALRAHVCARPRKLTRQIYEYTA
jgi:uncharacterized protein YndB with AHSA1/START domain